jgi:hypothetical protein
VGAEEGREGMMDGLILVAGQAKSGNFEMQSSKILCSKILKIVIYKF